MTTVIETSTPAQNTCAMHRDEVDGIRVMLPGAPFSVYGSVIRNACDDWRNDQDLLHIAVTPAQAKALGWTVAAADEDDRESLTDAGYDLPDAGETQAAPSNTVDNRFAVNDRPPVQAKPGMRCCVNGVSDEFKIVAVSQSHCMARNESDGEIWAVEWDYVSIPVQAVPDNASLPAAIEAKDQLNDRCASYKGLSMLKMNGGDTPTTKAAREELLAAILQSVK